jgi:glycosyltransferase involved in cell wall biosynthesis
MLHEQAEALGIGYEIIVADDGSTDKAVVEENRQINALSHCRLIEQAENQGRAAIRNFLAQQAKYPWLVFIDSDMVVRRPDFLRCYVDTPDEEAVWDGGISVGGDAHQLKHNLRYQYERANEHLHTAERRQQEPYRDFHTANFMIPKQLMTKYPFDLRFRYYGYEDVLFGMTLESHRIPIHHLDNPLSFEVFEENEQFLNKTEEGLRTLYTFRHVLKDGSRLLQRMEYLGWILPLLRLFHHATKKLERRILLRHPSLFLFSLYRLGYFATLSEK